MAAAAKEVGEKRAPKKRRDRPFDQPGRASEHARTAAPFYGGYGTKGNANADCHKRNIRPNERGASLSALVAWSDERSRGECL